MVDEEGQVPDEGTESADAQLPEDEPPEPVTVESLAMKAGWTPKDQFKGDPEKWRPADEFLLAGKEKVRGLGKELKGLKETVSRMSTVHETLLQEQLKEQERKLLSQRREAIEAGEVETVDLLDKQRDQLKARSQSLNGGKPPEIADFERENEWLGRDRKATALAFEVCEDNKHLPVPEQLRLAQAEVHKRFPEYAPRQPKEGPRVQQPTSRSAERRSGKRGFNDLPPEAQKAARDFEERHGVSKDKYAELYFKKQEKVG